MFYKKSVLKNFAKFTGTDLSQSLFFNKVAGLRPTTLFKERLWHRCFPVNFAKFSRTPLFIEHLWWLLLESISRTFRHQITQNLTILQKQSPRGVLRKSCLKNMQQFYLRTPILCSCFTETLLKSHFDMVVNLLCIFRTPFYKNTYWGLLLKFLDFFQLKPSRTKTHVEHDFFNVFPARVCLISNLQLYSDSRLCYLCWLIIIDFKNFVFAVYTNKPIE